MKIKSRVIATLSVGALATTLGISAASGTASPPEDSGATEKVIIDADMGQLNDDAVAMFALLNDENTDVLGVTTVAGNTWAEEGTAYTLKQLEIVGHEDIPVYQGAGGPLMGDRQAQLEAEQLLWGNSEYIGAWSRERPASYLELANEPYQGYPETEPQDGNAVDFIVDTVKANPGEVTLFVLGPATNVALAVRTYPEIVPLVKQVFYMGGAIDIPGNTTPAAEFNWWFDPEAIKITLNTPFERQVVVPNDIAERVYYTKDLYDRVIEGEITPVRQMFLDLHGPRFEADPDRQSYVWDLLTAAIFIDPSIATEVQERYIDIDVNYGPNYGRSIGYHESRNRDFDDPSNFPVHTQKVEILFDIDREAFADFYVEYVGGLDSDGAEPTDEPTEEPTEEPSGEPTGEPSGEPTGEPTDKPTGDRTDPAGTDSDSDDGGSDDSAGDPADGDLPSTGASVVPLILTALALLGVAVTLLAARRRAQR